MTSISHLKAHQAAKMREIGEALVAVGYHKLDDQAAALGLSRSTTWTIIKGTHKGSGLTAATLNRMLSAPDLHPLVRRKVLEYIENRCDGRYGSTRNSRDNSISNLEAVRQNRYTCSHEVEWCRHFVG